MKLRLCSFSRIVSARIGSLLPCVLALTLTSSLGLEWPLDAKSLEIRIPEKASASEQYAAKELQTYFQKMSGAAIPILEGNASTLKKTILLGRHQSSRQLWEKLEDPNYYVIDASPGIIRIAGGYQPPVTNAKGQEFVFDRGSLYGAYQLLEDQGIRWFRPEPEGEHVPKSNKLVVPNGRREFKPTFMLRWGVALYASHFTKAATKEQDLMARIWALRNKSNVIGLYDAKYGASLYIGGGGHAYSFLVPPSLFKEHPDFFPLIDGKRTPKGQLCLGNPELQDFFAAKLIQQGIKEPQTFMTSIDPNDGRGWCECPLCAAMDDPNLTIAGGKAVSMSNRVMTFNNIIAKKVAAEVPKLRLYSLAYSSYMEAPTRVKKIAPNLVIGLTPFAGAFSDYTKSITDPSSTPNKRFLTAIRGFQKLDAVMFAREYLSNYAWPGPLPLLWVMQDRFQEYAKSGFIGVYSETHPCWGPQGILLYMYLRLLWYPNLDLQQELKNYCRDFFGPAAEPMLHYYEALEKRGKGGPYLGSGGSEAQNLFTTEFLDELEPFIQKATQAAQGKPPYDWRVEGTAAGFQLARLYRNTAEQIKHGDIAEAKKSMDAMESLFGKKYPEGDVFNKGELYASHPDGKPRIPTFLREIKKQLAQADTLGSQYKNAQVVESFDQGWKFHTDPENHGVEQAWHQAQTKDTDWAQMSSEAPWQQQGYGDYLGTAWYRREFVSPPLQKNQHLILAFSAVDGDATVWVNGKEVGRHDLFDLDGINCWDAPFDFDITDFVNPQGKPNTLAVRVTKTSGAAGIYRSVKLLRVEK